MKECSVNSGSQSHILGLISYLWGSSALSNQQRHVWKLLEVNQRYKNRNSNTDLSPEKEASTVWIQRHPVRLKHHRGALSVRKEGTRASGSCLRSSWRNSPHAVQDEPQVQAANVCFPQWYKTRLLLQEKWLPQQRPSDRRRAEPETQGQVWRLERWITVP